MIRKLGLIALLTLLVSGAWAQNQQTSGLATPVTTSQITLPVYTLNPAPASGANLAIVGNPGRKTLYYWISANYPVGSATLAGPFTTTNAPDTLSASRYVTINPTLPGGVTSYDVLKTSTPIQPSGACACAVATAVSPGAVTNDQSNSTSAYTVAPVNVGLLVMTLANEVQSSGVSHLIARQNGVFVADLSTGGSAIPGLTAVTSPNGLEYSLGGSLYWRLDASGLYFNSGIAGSGNVVLQNTYAAGANNQAGGIILKGAPSTGEACAGAAALLGGGNGSTTGGTVQAGGVCANGIGTTGAPVYITGGSTSAGNTGGSIYLQPGTGGFGNGSIYLLAGLSAGCLDVNGSGVLASTGSPCGSASGAFGSLTGGTNTGAAMLVGTGASLGTTGTGTIAATTAANLSGTPTLPSGTVLPGYASLSTANTFVGDQTITGNLNVSGAITQTGGGPTLWSGNAQTGSVTVPGGSDFSLFVSSSDQLSCQLSTALGGGSCLPSGSSYTLPAATSSTLGGVSPDGASILNTAGAISVTPTSIGLGNVTNHAQIYAATGPLSVSSGTESFAASLLNYGGDGGGSADNSTAMTAACAANSEVWLPAGAFAFTSSYALPCPVHFGAGSTLVAPQGVTLSNVVVSSAPPNVQLFTLGAGATGTDNFTRTNENPLSDAGNWTVGGGWVGVTVEAGQIVSNKYEPVTQSAGKVAYALWTGTGAWPADQCEEVTISAFSGTGSASVAVRGSTTTSTNYYILLTASTFSITKVTGGSGAVLKNITGWSYTFAAGDKLKLCASGSSTTTITGYLNGGPQLSVADSSSPITSGYPGIMIYTNNSAIALIQYSNATATALTGSTAPGLVTMSASQTVSRPEWFGAAGNGTSACAGTDDTIPIQQASNSLVPYGGNVLFGEKIYQITAAEYLPASLIGWLGALQSLPAIPGTEILQCGQANADILDITGTSAVNITSNKVQDLMLAASKAGTPPSSALLLRYAELPHVTNVRLYDRFNLINHWTSSNSFLREIFGYYTYGAPTNSIGYNYNPGIAGANSSVAYDLWVQSPYIAIEPTTDLTIFDLGIAAPAAYGVYVNSTIGCPEDVHFIAPVIDSGTAPAIYITGCTALPGFIEFDNIYSATGVTNVPQISIIGSVGIHIIGGTVFSSSLTSPASIINISGAGSQGDLLTGLHLNTTGGTTGDGTCILVSGGATDNTISNNDCAGTSSKAFATAFAVTGSSGNTIANNNCWGYGATCYSFDSTSNNNQFRANTANMTHVTTRVSDAGAGNSKNWNDQGQCTLNGSTGCAAQTLSNGTTSGSSTCWGNYVSGVLTGILSFPSTATTVTPASSVGADSAIVNWFCNEN